MSPTQPLVRISEGSPAFVRAEHFIYFSSGFRPELYRNTPSYPAICEQLLRDYFFRYFENSTLDITMIDDYLGMKIAVCHFNVTTSINCDISNGDAGNFLKMPSS